MKVDMPIKTFRPAALRFALLVALSVVAVSAFPVALTAQMSAAATAPTLGTGILPAEQVEKLLPPSVYFSHQTAPLQLRNSAAFRGTSGDIVWAGLVDTSGYSTGVRERYQLYLVTETRLQFGDKTLPTGVYGAGFLADGRFAILDVSGRTVVEGQTKADDEMKRPRPLQMVEHAGELRLYLGRQYVTLKPLGAAAR